MGLLTMTNDTIKEESWLGSKRATYRVQKATLTVKEKVQKVEDFSNYLISPMRKRYDVVFRSTAMIFKSLTSWLKLKPSAKAPKSWEKRRKAISNRIMSLSREPKKIEDNGTSGPV